ncbi:unnamed protein product [Arabis nemorensis]|uniref:Uncharacterized protein n=1 Tax=Arabis nemorensis TaxID=586526 RepID=A0A565B5N7_9BRAS|nr:unnamed protein product [Arabis nemorensis]
MAYEIYKRHDLNVSSHGCAWGGVVEKRMEVMGVSREFDELLERILVEHEEKAEEHQDRDMMDLLLEAYRDEKAEYKITRNQIKALFVVN